MRLLHTSDWHVGRTLRGLSRADEHRAVLAEVVAAATAHGVDLVLVTGDLFDTAAPTPEAEQIVYRTLLDLEATGALVVVLAGNHDNARRLDAVAPLLQRGRVVVRSSWLPPGEGGVVEAPCSDGSTAQVACLPFLSQRSVLRADELMEGSAADLAGGYKAVVRALVADLAGALRPDAVKVFAGHLFADGATAGGSERTAHIADGYVVPVDVFPTSLHYVALGHLHRPQEVRGPTVRYAGSPLQLDFGEAEEEKSVTVVEATPTSPARITLVPLRAGRKLRTIDGTLDQLRSLSGSTGDALLKVVVRDHARAGLADEIRELFPHCIDVFVAAPAAERKVDERADRRGRAPGELFASYLEERMARDERVQALFGELVDATASEEVGAGAT